MSEHDSIPAVEPRPGTGAEPDDAPSTPLAALRVDVTPARDLWAGIATRIDDPSLRDHCELPAPLQAALTALPRDAVPGRDLWSGVAARIEVRTKRPRRATWQAAAASLAASLLVVVGLVVDRDAGSDIASAKVPLRPSAEAFAATIGHTRGSEDAAALQRASYRPISREARALVRANLKIVDSAEAQIEKAMADDPDDAAYLEALLDSARQQQQGLRATLAERP